MDLDDMTKEYISNPGQDPDSGSTRGTDTSSHSGQFSHDLEFLYLDHFPSSKATAISPNGDHIDRFLQYHDQYFIRNAYLAILQREPDPEGFSYYLLRLRNAALTKQEILGRLRYSKEGREKGFKIKGLLPNYVAQTLFRMPLIGYIIRLFVGILRLPVLISNYQKFDLHAHTQFMQLSEYLNRTTGLIQTNVNGIISNMSTSLETLASIKADSAALDALAAKIDYSVPELTKLESALVELRADMSHLLKKLKDKVELVDFTRYGKMVEEIRERKADLSLVEQLMSAIEGISSSKVDRSEFELAPRPQLEQEVSTLEQEVSTLKQVIQHLRRTVIEQDRKLWLFLQEAKKRLPDPFSEEQIERLLREEDHLLDALYVSFEDQFRGTRIDIKNRLRVYLPFIEEAGAGTAEAPVVDLGCGRGEWLEILQESNLHAVGVDRNRIMLQQCRELNLKVIENDAVQFLHGQNGNSLGAITGHHIIEHLDLTTLITLLDECFRTLKPGGILIFETPNPENLLVGAYSFHFDPTHKKVQVPDSLRFLVEQRGFSRTQILRLNRYSDLCQSDDDADDFRKKWFYSEMDFAIIAYKS